MIIIVLFRLKSKLTKGSNWRNKKACKFRYISFYGSSIWCKIISLSVRPCNRQICRNFVIVLSFPPVCSLMMWERLFFVFVFLLLLFLTVYKFSPLLFLGMSECPVNWLPLCERGDGSWSGWGGHFIDRYLIFRSDRRTKNRLILFSKLKA